MPAGIAISTVNALSLGFAKAGGAGFQQGGYTGNKGVSTVAGVVHGQEFVMHAEATRKNRALLEAMNAGWSPEGMGGYQSGGYVGGGSYSAPAVYSGGAPSGGSGGWGGGDKFELHIGSITSNDPRAVREQIDEAMDEALPVFLAQANKQKAKQDKDERGRVRIGGGRS